MLLAYSNSWASSSYFFLNIYANFFKEKKKWKRKEKEIPGGRSAGFEPAAHRIEK